MKIAFDFHGVLESYPDKLKSILKTLKIDHTIIVLSGPPLGQIYDELSKAGYYQGYHYDYAISVVDWIKDQGIEMWLNERDSWYCDDEIWWSSKAKICIEHNIGMMFDDNLRYKEYITNNNPLFLHIE